MMMMREQMDQTFMKYSRALLPGTRGNCRITRQSNQLYILNLAASNGLSHENCVCFLRRAYGTRSRNFRLVVTFFKQTYNDILYVNECGVRLQAVLCHSVR